MPPDDVIVAPDAAGLAEAGEVLRARVTNVFDGDGFLAVVLHPAKQTWVGPLSFRLAFVDAPELGQEFGSEARTHLEQHILGKELSLAPIGKQSTGYNPLDQYRRFLCMAFLEEEVQPGGLAYYWSGGSRQGTIRQRRSLIRNIELELIVNGLAWVLERYTFDREEEYLAAQEEARAKRRGLWALDKPQPPWQFKARQKKRSLSKASQPPLL